MARRNFIPIKYRRNRQPPHLRRCNCRVFDAITGFLTEDTKCVVIDGEYIDVTKHNPDWDPKQERMVP